MKFLGAKLRGIFAKFSELRAIAEFGRQRPAFHPPCLLRRSSRFGCEGRAPRLRRVLLAFILAASCEVFGEGE